MFFNEFVSQEILNLTKDDAKQKLFMTHRYLLCSYVVCRYILNNETDAYLRHLVKPYKDNLRVAVVYMEDSLELGFSNNKKEKNQVKEIFDESWSYARKELENYVSSNFITKEGIAKQIKIANFYAYEILKAIVSVEDNDDIKNITNLKN